MYSLESWSKALGPLLTVTWSPELFQQRRSNSRGITRMIGCSRGTSGSGTRGRDVRPRSAAPRRERRCWGLKNWLGQWTNHHHPSHRALLVLYYKFQKSTIAVRWFFHDGVNTCQSTRVTTFIIKELGDTPRTNLSPTRRTVSLFFQHHRSPPSPLAASKTL